MKPAIEKTVPDASLLFDIKRQTTWSGASLEPLQHVRERSRTRDISPRVYIASKTSHAEKWLNLRERGVPIIATWIDEAGQGQSASLRSLAERCISEASESDALILYCEDGEILKGALLECGAALANRIPVYAVGNCQSLSAVFEHHPCWFQSETVESALGELGILL